MYNLFVSGREDAWQGEPIFYDVSRCISAQEGTSADLVSAFSNLEPHQVEELKKFPCIFVYEQHRKLNPKFGFITDVIKRHGKVKVSYELIELESDITLDLLEDSGFDLDIAKYFFNRTHWAIKSINLYYQLAKLGIKLPIKAKQVGSPESSQQPESSGVRESVEQTPKTTSSNNSQSVLTSILGWLNTNAPALTVIGMVVAGFWALYVWNNNNRDSAKPSLNLQPTTKVVDQLQEKPCDSNIFSIAGSSKQLNPLATIDTFTSNVVKGATFNFRVNFRDNINVETLSCLQVHICSPESENFCRTVETFYERVSGQLNAFSYQIGSQYEAGQHRLILKLIQVKDPRVLEPREDGSYRLSDYQRFHTSKNFLIKNLQAKGA